MKLHTLFLILIVLACGACEHDSRIVNPNNDKVGNDKKPSAILRLEAEDQGIVLRYGDGPDNSDVYGARDVWVFEDNGTYYMHYDAAGPRGWLAALATSKDLRTWEKKGPVLDLGAPGERDAGSASYGVTYKDGDEWHMFYLATPNTSPPPERVPMIPYMTLKAKASSPSGPWVKQRNLIPFSPKEGTYYAIVANPGHIIRQGSEYLIFFSAAHLRGNQLYRTLGIARTRSLDGTWQIDPTPILPSDEQIENASLYFEPENNTWFLFTNHVGRDSLGHEYTDAIWVYWSKDLDRWDPNRKAVVLDAQASIWSKRIIGLPSVIQVSDTLAIFYDGREFDDNSHMGRHIGLATLPLPLIPPSDAAN